MSDPAEKTKIRYIGKTEQLLHRRLAVHVADLKRTKLPRNHRISWTRKLLSQGRTPLIWPIEVCSKSDWQKREIHWINFFKPLGFLTNTAEGGKGGGVKGWKWSKEALERISKLRKGKCPSKQCLEASRIAKLTYRHSKESLAKMSLAQRRSWLKRTRPEKQLEMKLLLRNKRKGYKHSPETIEKIRAKTKGVLRPHVTMSTGKPIECIETGERFVSLWRASQAKNVSCSHIRRSMQRGHATKGVHWRLIRPNNT